MSFKSNIIKIFESKKTLHILFAVTLFNIIGYLIYGNYNAVAMFLLIAGIVAHFSKNLSIVLLIPLFIVNLLALGNKTKEGMETTNSSNTNNKIKTQNSSEDSTQDASGNTLKDTIKKINDKSSTKQGLPITPIDNNTNTTTDNTTEESFEVGRNKKGKYDIDYASTIEDAYDELNKIIGGDGIKKLTGDTQNLIKQQMQLAEAMKSMGPLVEQMEPLMQSIGPMLNQAKGFMGSGSNSIADLAKNFTADTKK